MKKLLLIVSAVFLIFSLLAGCASTDVILQYSPGALDTITSNYPAIVTDNAAEDGYYDISVDGLTSLKISRDFSQTGSEDLLIQTPLQPFVDAGLDVASLSAGLRADADYFYVTGDYGSGSGSKDNLTKALFESVAYDRSMLTYHLDLDHYGIKLSGGKFEWAKDYKTNDKDIVFVIAAKPLADLGVDVENIDGWVFKTMKDDDGSDIDVLLKPYNLE